MTYKVSNKTPSKKDVAYMLRRTGVISNGGIPGFDFSKIENSKAIDGIAGYLAKKVPSYYNVVVGFISDNSGLSRSVAEHLKAKHYFTSQYGDVGVTLSRFNGTKKVNVLLVKALIDDIEMDSWHNLSHVNGNIQRLATAVVADGRFLPRENYLEVFSLTDYNHIHAD